VVTHLQECIIFFQLFPIENLCSGGFDEILKKFPKKVSLRFMQTKKALHKRQRFSDLHNFLSH
jgi:hypothetical protein